MIKIGRHRVEQRIVILICDNVMNHINTTGDKDSMLPCIEEGLGRIQGQCATVPIVSGKSEIIVFFADRLPFCSIS